MPRLPQCQSLLSRWAGSLAHEVALRLVGEPGIQQSGTVNVLRGKFPEDHISGRQCFSHYPTCGYSTTVGIQASRLLLHAYIAYLFPLGFGLLGSAKGSTRCAVRPALHFSWNFLLHCMMPCGWSR